MQTAAGWWALACAAALVGGACTPKKDKPDQVVTAQSTGAVDNGPDAPESLRVESPAFKQQGEIPKKYTCEGTDTQPPLSFGGVPAPAKSLVLIVDDPDAPAGTWVHWVVYNLPPSTKKLDEGMAALPGGAVVGVNDFKKAAWGGPCPPSGRHRYFFKLYALDAVLPKLDGATKASVERAMHGHVIARGELVGTYQKSG